MWLVCKYTASYVGAAASFIDTQTGQLIELSQGTQPSFATNQRRHNQGAVSIRKTVLPGMAIPMLKIRRPNGRLIFNMEIAICR